LSGRRLTALLLFSVGIGSAQRVGAPTDDLGNRNADDLFRLEVTSVGKKSTQLSKAPAVYVLIADDIRRSGATSVPEALQWVPGLTVLRVRG
jgi:iron complex outermembrane receptor protein